MAWLPIIATCCLWPGTQSRSASVNLALAREAVWFRKEVEQICLPGPDSDAAQCVSTRDFTEEELLNILEPLLARIPAKASGRTSWRAIIGSLAVTLSTWTLMLSCLRICCRQKTSKKARISCTLLHRWVRDCGDVFFSFPLMGARVVLDKLIVSPLAVAHAAFLRRRAEHTLRMQNQLLAEGGNTPGAGRKRERASINAGGMAPKAKRKSAPPREKPKDFAARSSATLHARSAAQEVPETLAPAPEGEELATEQWCQVHRHCQSEHPKRAVSVEPQRTAQASRPVVPLCQIPEAAQPAKSAPSPKVELSSPKPSASVAEVAPKSLRVEASRPPPTPASAARKPQTVPATLPPPCPLTQAQGKASTTGESQREPSGDPLPCRSSSGAPPDAPLPPSRRPSQSSEPEEKPKDPDLPLILAPRAPAPSHPPELQQTPRSASSESPPETLFSVAGLTGKVHGSEGQVEEPKDIEADTRPPPPDVPPPPCPAGQEILRWLQQPPEREAALPLMADMGCFSGGTGGTPGWEAFETTAWGCKEAVAFSPPYTASECQSRFTAEDDVGKRLEAMVEELAGPSSFELLEDAFSKVDAAREALSRVVSEPGLHHAAPVFIPGQLWPGRSRMAD